jgi:hypothetical protein
VAWIESHQELAHHPKVARLARSLDVSVPAAIGHLHLFWWWCLSYADDGDVSEFTAFELAHGAQWQGDPDRFVEALRGDWIDDVGVGWEVHDWHEYAGKLVERRRADAERKRAGRRSDVPRTSTGQTKTGVKAQGTSTGRPTDDREDGVRTQPTNPTNPTQPTTFVVFHKQRADDYVQQEEAKGKTVRSPGGLAATMVADPQFQAESKRIWEHRDCDKCAGAGFTSVYSPGSGGRKLKCQ